MQFLIKQISIPDTWTFWYSVYNVKTMIIYIDFSGEERKSIWSLLLFPSNLPNIKISPISKFPSQCEIFPYDVQDLPRSISIYSILGAEFLKDKKCPGS